ncbi:G8 domain-containing protein [Marinivivus vitaminiproducens]|uniref:G8 domain-containing protein n=1 Tax=Marinivivus vitaminiproducens TaxID=3035935 RepID=UPI0027A52937|nr:G8 domain-containing protein [Geminicoccaceae bacterium SCSIO 64248]
MDEDDHEFRDPQMEAEHQAALDLVRPEEATHVAVQNGAWFDPATWQGGQVPDPGSVVHIPEGITVGYNGTSDSSINKIRVDGKLDFTTDTDTKLVVDTMVVQPGAVLEIGTADDPIQSGHTANIVFADNGSVNDLDWDVRQLSRGLINLGDLEFHGEDKTSFLRAGADPMAGDTSITLASAPSNWQVGDTIVLTGTDYIPERSGQYQGTYDEVRTITSIDGNTVGFEEPLRYNHDTPAAELKAYAANMTRNITLESQNSAEVDHRAHFMSMHSNNVDIENAAFVGMGRTDKSEPLDDRRIVEGEDGSVSAPFVPGTEHDNPRGRYAVHMHRTGADNDAATIEGSVVWGSPGWGMVSHDSHADFIDNVAYDVFGAHYASETGNERGEWTHNIAIKGEGRDPTRFEKYDVATHDLGYEGNGFWFNGRQVVAQDNVAAGMSGFAYEWFNRGDNMIDSTSSNLTHPEIANTRPTIPSERPAIEGFTDNEALASWGGIFVHRAFYTQFHDQRSFLSGFKGWEVAEGVKATYTNNYLFENMEFWDADRYNTTIGADIGKNTKSITLRDVEFNDFRNGVILRKDFEPLPPGSDPLTEDHQYYFIGVDFNGVTYDYSRLFNPESDHVLEESDLTDQPLELDLTDSSLLVTWGSAYGDRGLTVRGTKSDSIGEVGWPAARDRIELDYNTIVTLLRDQGFWTLMDGTRVTPITTLYSDRATAEIDTKTFLAVFDDDWPMPTSNTSYVYNGTWLDRDGVYLPTALMDPADIATGGTESDGRFRINGSDADNRMSGINNRRDLVYGLAGEDTITGRGGDDEIYGGDGADGVYGGGGDDAVYGGADGDTVEGGEGNDNLYGGDGDDVIRSGGGGDVAYGGIGNDDLYGDGGTDTLYGDEGNDRLYGSSGNDTLFAGAGDDRVSAWTGNDIVYAGTGVDTVYGEDGDDRLYGHGGDDVIRGGNGDDWIDGGADADTIYGEDGIDTVYGGDGNDLIYAGADDDRVEGGAGDDDIYGETGNDTLIGDAGDDRLYGSSGNDDLTGGDGADRLGGWTGNDVLYGGGDGDSLYGEDGNDDLFGGDGDDTLRGGDGEDRLAGGPGVDQLYGDLGDDVFVAKEPDGAGPDQIRDFRTGDRIDFSDVLPDFDADTELLSDYVSKRQSGSTITFSLDADGSGSGTSEPVIQALAPAGGQLSGNGIDALHDQGILIA